MYHKFHLFATIFSHFLFVFILFLFLFPFFIYVVTHHIYEKSKKKRDTNFAFIYWFWPFSVDFLVVLRLHSISKHLAIVQAIDPVPIENYYRPKCHAIYSMRI